MTQMTPEALLVISKILLAVYPEDVFGEGASKEVNAAFRHLASVIHPDKYPDSKERVEVTRAFQKLTAFKIMAESKLDIGTYGKRTIPLATPAPTFTPVGVTIGKKKYTVSKLFLAGDVADLYRCETGGNEVIFKIARSPGDNDLLENESKMLKKLYPDTAKDEKFYRYLPRLTDSFMIRTKGVMRRANILPLLEEYFSLEEVLSAFPGGMDVRDVVWMYKRTLAAIGFVHREGFVHGAVLPSHVLIHPKEHGAKLVDWSYAVEKGGKIKAAVKAYSDFYAPEILKKSSASPATDIYMASKCAVALLGGNVKTNVMPPGVPAGIQGFLKSCLVESPLRRPDNAWALHEEFDALLLRTVGKPKYRPLTLPGRL